MSEEQQSLTPPADGPGQSPSLLAKPPTRGEGVRRLNARPVIAVGAGLCLAIGAAGYTLHDRMARAAASARPAAHKPEPGNGASVLQGAPVGGEILPAAARAVGPQHPGQARSALGATQQPPASAPSDGGGNGQGQQGEDDATKARREAWRTYYVQLAQVQKDKLDAARAALMAESGMGNNQVGGQQPTAAAAGGVPTAPGAMEGATGAMPSGVLPGGVPGGYGVAGGYGGLPIYPPAQVNGSAQREKQAFLKQSGDLTGASDDLPAVIRDPASPFMVMQGTAIPATMDIGVNSDIPGQIRAKVADPVYDTATGNFLLIPGGSTLIGEYDNMVSQGQTRMAVIWHRIIFPDTSSINIGSMAGADQAGYSGFHDQVNTHLWSKLGNAMLISIAAAGVQLAQGTGQNTNGYNAQQIAAGALGQQFGELGQEYARAGLSIPNTLEIRPGYRFVVMVNRDMHLRPYVDRRGGGNTTAVNFGPVVQ